MNPLLKYPGGKTKELPLIKEHMPKQYKNYIEPFMGGGAVFFDIVKTSSTNKFSKLVTADSRKYYLNDNFKLLIKFYQQVQSHNKEFYEIIRNVGDCFKSVQYICDVKFKELNTIYNDFCEYNSQLQTEEFLKSIYDSIGFSDDLHIDKNEFVTIVADALTNKFTRCNNQNRPNLQINFTAGIAGGYYTYFRKCFNDYQHGLVYYSDSLAATIFYFVCEYCFSGKFTYNSNGNFNSAYGGIGYNSKDFNDKLPRIMSCNAFNNAEIYNLDFEQFFNSIPLTKDDFIFLDPPYDTVLSNYSGLDFTQDDHRRLSDYIHKCSAQWMMVVKSTELIDSLYSDLNVLRYDMVYNMNTKNENNREVQHLMITNY